MKKTLHTTLEEIIKKTELYPDQYDELIQQLEALFKQQMEEIIGKDNIKGQGKGMKNIKAHIRNKLRAEQREKVAKI